MSLIKVSGLTKVFKTYDRKEGVWGGIQNLFVRKSREIRAVDNINFSIDEGEMVGYIGANGAGKSTTIKMLTGILVPSHGTIEANGFIPYRDRHRYTHRIGVVFGQRTQLWWDIAVVESFQLLKRIYQIPERKFQEQLDTFNSVLDLKPLLGVPVRKLSLGQRMRCDLAAAFLHSPKIVFLDEPTIGLDLVAKENIRQFLKRINRELKVTVLLTTHDLSDIEELCRRVMIIDGGRLLFDGTLESLRKRFECKSQVLFELREPTKFKFDSLGLESSVDFREVDPLHFQAVFNKEKVSSAELIKTIVNSLSVRDIALDDTTIEEIVREIYTRGGIE